MRPEQELAERNNLAAQIESAKRAVANWPADVKAAMGLEPTPSAEVIELRSKLPRWRKVEDEVPPNRTRVLAYWPGLSTTLGGPVDTVFYVHDIKFPWGGSQCGAAPTHWMPLPEPPK